MKILTLKNKEFKAKCKTKGMKNIYMSKLNNEFITDRQRVHVYAKNTCMHKTQTQTLGLWCRIKFNLKEIK